MKIRQKPHLSKHFRSKDSEKKLVKTFSAKNARRQPASGAVPVARLKGDVRTDKFLIEDKVTLKKSFSLSIALWNKLRLEAFQGGRKEPVLRITLGDGTTLYTVSKHLFEKTWR